MQILILHTCKQGETAGLAIYKITTEMPNNTLVL